jgi:hypothetical protein
VLCRIEDDSSLTPISEHEDISAGVAAGKHRVEVEDFDFGYALVADGMKVASFAEGRVGYREWAHRNGRRFELFAGGDQAHPLTSVMGGAYGEGSHHLVPFGQLLFDVTTGVGVGSMKLGK